ncbi:MAG TPA: fibronectin type III domain-containing protein [Anaeromyxobacter sp.]
MRRPLLLVAALAMPALGAAQTVPTGVVQFVEPGTTNDIIHGAWINATKCANQATTNVILQWTATQAWVTGGSYQINAANQDLPSNSTTCPFQNNSSTGLYAAKIGVPITNQPFKSVSGIQEPVSAFLAAVNQTSCSITSTVTIYVCVQQLDQNGAAIGYAKGQLKFEVTPPGAPTGVTAGPLDTGALEVSWTQPNSSPQAYDYLIEAQSVTSPADSTPDARDPALHTAGPTDPYQTHGTIGGLTDGVMYAVTVIARSQAANESGPGGPAYAVPQVVNDFWDQYRQTPGAVERGGCATAGAGPLALLGLAALVAALRRRT